MSFITGLSRAGQRVYHFLIEGLKQGLSGTEIMKILREHGLGYRLTDFYNDLRILRGEMMRWDTMKYVPREKVITERLYTPTTTPLPSRFSTVMRVEYINLETGEEGETYITLHHDTPLKRLELEEMAAKAVLEESEEYTGYTHIKVRKVVPERGFIRV